MITISKINTGYNQVCDLLHSRKIKDALDQLRKLIAEVGYSDFFVQQEHLESTYEQMLKYTLDGIHDPERERIYMKLQASVVELADRVRAALLKKYSGWHTLTLQEELNKQQKLTGKGIIESLDDLAFSVELDEIINEDKTTPLTTDLKRRDLMMDIFKHLWLTDNYGEVEHGLVGVLIGCRDFTWYEQSLHVTAILLSALRYFEEEKIHHILDFIEVQDQQVRGRALVSAVILLHSYDKRLYLYPNLMNRLDLLRESTDMDTILEQIILQLTRTEDTLELGKKLHEDIIPEMAKLQPKLEDKLKMDDLRDEDSQDEKNPDWESVFMESDDLYKKVDEFMKLQMEGADVYMTTFAQLKNFSFFNELTNWLIPFYEENPDLKELYKMESENFQPEMFISGMKQMPFLCNSDKYSFIFNVKYLPDDQKGMLSTAFAMEMEGLSEMLSDEELLNENFARRIVFVQFVQDLYRFFKLSPFKNEFEDVFKGKFEIYKSYFFRKLVDNKNIVRNIAEYFFEKGHYNDALDIFLSEQKENPDDMELLEKSGYCYQQMGNYHNAIAKYECISDHENSNSWVVRNLGLCYRKIEDYNSALQVYQRAAINNPEDIRLESLIGFCNMKIGQYDTALKHYFKIEYLEPDNTNVIRPIAWCYFAMGELEKSEKYYNRVFELDPDYYDFVNFGHLKWAMGDRKAAIEYYLQSITKEKFTFNDLQKTIDEDTQMLLKGGVDQEEIPLMMDYLRYRLKLG